MARFEAAGTAGGGWRGFGGARLAVGFHFHGLIIARPFVLLQREDGRQEGAEREEAEELEDGCYGPEAELFAFGGAERLRERRRDPRCGALSESSSRCELVTVGCRLVATLGCRFFSFAAWLGGLVLLFVRPDLGAFVAGLWGRFARLGRIYL